MPSLNLSFWIWLLPLIGLALAIFIILQAQRISKRPQNNTEGIQPIIIGTAPVGKEAKPSIRIKASKTQLTYEDGNGVLIEVPLELHTTLPVQMNSIRLVGLGKDIYEYPKKRRLGDVFLDSDLYGSAYFLKPRNISGQKEARVWINTGDSPEHISDIFTIDFDQQPELHE